MRWPPSWTGASSRSPARFACRPRAARPGPAGSLHALLGALGVAPLAEATWRAVDPAGQSLRDLDRPEQLAGPVHLPRRT
jgi:hypothetical protein